MHRIKNVLITGKPGSGKTTFILNLISKLNIPAYGFYTKEIRKNGERVGFELITLKNERDFLAHKNIKSEFVVGKYGVKLDALENIGIKSIEEGLEKQSIIIIDEIGKMELFSKKFVDTLFKVINSKSKLIATIMEKSHPIADKIKKMKNSAIFNIKEASIEKILSIINE